MEMIQSVTKSILMTLYEQTGFALLLAILFMFLYQYVKEHGIKNAALFWGKSFLEDHMFRRIFLLALYVAMILFRTLFNRSLWLNPLSNVFGSWTIYYYGNGQIATEAVENLLLFLPFSLLLLWSFGEKIVGKKKKYRSFIWAATKYTFLFSICVEFSQLFFRLGTFQISDLVYNTLGGTVGGILYYMLSSMKKFYRKTRNKRKYDK